VVAASGVGICLMHMSDEPDVMQQNPDYENVVATVVAFLAERVDACEQAGISRNRIMIDPGFGFGKTLQHNLRLFEALPTFCGLGLPVLVGVSRKSMIGAVTGRPARGRVAGGLALATLADQAGAAVIRTHDVAATRDALMMYRAVVDESNEH
jgi:dihydropteroate synthase